MPEAEKKALLVPVAIFLYVLNVIIEAVIVGIEMERFIASFFIGFIFTILLGGPFGRYLDILRQKAHV